MSSRPRAVPSRLLEGWLSVEWEKRWHPELAEPELALPRELAALRAVMT
jgi:hypothetical protein